jgi:hypothetical protein
MVTEAFPCPETIWLAEVLRGEPRWPPQNMDKNAIQRVLTAANSNDVQELLFTKLHSNSIWEQLPDRLRQRLHDAHRHAIARELFLQEETAKDLDALAAAGIDVLLLKGTALAYNLYASPALRPRRDVDLLMHDKSTAHKAWHLLEQRGYTRDDAIGGDLISHEYCCARKVPPSAGVVLDVHWKLSNSHFFAQKFSYDELRCKRVPVPMLGSGAYALGAVHALIHALFHRAWSLGGNEPDRLIWLYDIDLLCRHLSREQWDEFALLVATRDLGPICREGLERARECYNTPIPGEIFAHLKPQHPRSNRQLELMRPGPGRVLYEIQSLGSWRSRLRYLRGHLFPSRHYMQQRFGADRGPALIFAYLRRGWGGIKKRALTWQRSLR